MTPAAAAVMGAWLACAVCWRTDSVRGWVCYTMTGIAVLSSAYFGGAA